MDFIDELKKNPQVYFAQEKPKGSNSKQGVTRRRDSSYTVRWGDFDIAGRL
jgi:hypothetical protein